jgi:hypothetical protein
MGVQDEEEKLFLFSMVFLAFRAQGKDTKRNIYYLLK